MPKDVDFKVMLTFLEFYETLLGFVNFKLFHTLGYKYPPVIDKNREAQGDQLGAVILHSKDAPQLLSSSQSTNTNENVTNHNQQFLDYLTFFLQ